MNKLRISICLLIATGCFTACHQQTDQAADRLRQPPYTALTDSIRATPGNPYFYFQRAILLQQNNDSALALQDFHHAWQLKKDPKFAFILSEYWLYHHQPDSAIALLRPVVQADPGNQYLQRNLLTAYFTKQQYNEALLTNQAALQHDSLSSGNWYNRALVEDAMHDSAAALHSMEHALRLDPQNTTIAFELANRYADAGNPATLRLTDFLLRTDTLQKTAELLTIRGIYYKNANEAPNAIATFNKAIQADYTFLDAYLQKGILLYQQKKYKDAIQVFGLATAVSNTFADGYFWTGRCEEQLGQLPEASLDYQRAIAFDKSFTEAREAYARVAAKLK